MKMRGKRGSGWYARCGCYIPGAVGGKELVNRAYEKRETQKEINQQVEELEDENHHPS